MTLNQYLKTIPKNQIIYISGGSGWFYIGTPADYRKHKKQIEKEMHDLIKDYSKAANYYVSYLSNKDTSKLEFAQYIKWWKKLEMKKNALRLLYKTLENWIPIDKRRVIRAYRKAIDDNGIGIKIEGPLHGRYWIRSEWEAEHGKIQV